MVTRTYRFLIENSLFLLIGAILGLIGANAFPSAFYAVQHSLHFIINDILMALFFGRAAKEIRESMLPGGALYSARKAALPLMATLGGMLGPALVYVTGAWVFDAELVRGWAIPTATDIAFSILVARAIFGAGHPAIPFLLLLAVADDGGGLAILALFYPQGELNLLAFGGLVALAMGGSLIMWKIFRVKSFWPYLLGPGVVSWFGFYLGGIHPALALVPLMWCMPHEHDDLGLYADAEEHKSDALNRFAHVFHHPIEWILLVFGFVAAGVQFTAIDTASWLVVGGLVIGKPLGITLFTLAGIALGLQLPRGMTKVDVVVLGSVAGIGFTVALFVSGVAFEAGPVQDAAKMGALFSFASAPLAWLLSKLLRR